MTITRYETTGKLTEPVNDLAAAQRFLDIEGGMAQYIKYHHADLGELVAACDWMLLDEGTWKVRVVAVRPLTTDERTRLSDWICGQNSDGIGEGFEQQPFAEHGDDNEWYDEDEDEWTDEYTMSSFDWADNDCELKEVA